MSRVASLVVAGLSGDAGKTLVSLAITLALRERGLDVRPFKKGPDYIDAAWLSWAAGRPARNLDTWMAGFDVACAAFSGHATPVGMNLVEGNRGLFDGVDPAGTHSTAELAKALAAPVVLVLDARKATTTLAATVLGCQAFDPALRIGGVVLNRVAGSRHEGVCRQAIEAKCGVPVLGVIPRLPADVGLPGRHLGLVTPAEHPAVDALRGQALETARRYLDLDALLAIAASAAPGAGAPLQSERAGAVAVGAQGERVRVGVVRDSAFSFYYPENLEALEDAGAVLVAVSSLTDDALPADLDALYIGGGFPETHAPRIAANRQLLQAIRDAAARQLPVYAECGGLMLLAQGLTFRGTRHAMAGVLAFDVEVGERPQGHGYTALLVDGDNPFFRLGTTLRGHEFHYSRPVPVGARLEASASCRTACAVRRGTGCGDGRDGVIVHNVFAAYTHLHALATPEWAPGVVAAARRYRATPREAGIEPSES